MSTDFRRPLPWQHALWVELTAQILQNRLSHALLLSGPAGVGKRWFARALVAFLLCERRSGYACGACRSCEQLSVGAHPNASQLGTDGLLGLALNADGRHEQGLIHWQPESDSKRRDISIDAARQLIVRLGLTAHYGGARAAIVDPADALNVSSVNALLKTIEEPPSATHLLLIAEQPNALPATLRSRCQRIRMPLPDREAALAWLDTQAGMHADADALAAAQGAPLRALELMRGDALGQQREWGELWLAVARRRTDPVAAAALIGRDAATAHLQWASHWLYGYFRTSVLDGAAAERVEAYDRMLARVADGSRHVASNAHPQMVLEALFVDWMRLGPRALGLG